jgi:hypothetical protein
VASSKLTHGEAYVRRKAMVGGGKKLDEIASSFQKLPPKMNRKEAIRYYSIKFTQYWLHHKF